MPGGLLPRWSQIWKHIVCSKDLGTSAPYRHVNFLKIIAIKWKSSYTVGSVIDHFQRSSSQARLGLIIVENDLEPPTVKLLLAVDRFQSPSLISCSHSCLRNSWCTSMHKLQEVCKGERKRNL